MPRSERGREKAATFSSLQNGWGPGESSSEQRGRAVFSVLLRGGLGDSAGISPLVFSSSVMPFVPLAGSRCGRMTYSCVVSAPETLLGHRARGRQPAGCGSHTATAPHRATWSILMCHPANGLSLLMPPEGSKCRSESQPVISPSI